MCLVPAKGSRRKHRTTITLAKYRLSKHLGRILKRHEEVDHKDGNKTNDAIGNLQILTKLQNLKKQQVEANRTKTMRTLKCPVCRIRFIREARQLNSKLDAGRKPCCSRQCGGKISHMGQ